MKNVLIFGAFDPLHEGHLNFFRQAKQLGDKVTAVVARDSTILRIKKHEPYQNENTRAEVVRNCGLIDDVRLGFEGEDNYRILDNLDFDVIALGYDQRPSEETILAELAKRGKTNITVVRLKPFQSDKYKSSFFRPENSK
jgi:FAD synthetase